MNKQQRAIYKCTKNCYRTLSKQTKDKSMLREWNEFYKGCKLVLKHASIPRIKELNKFYVYCYKNNIIL